MESSDQGRTMPERYNFACDVFAKLVAKRPEDRALLWVGPTGEMHDRSFAEIDAAAARAAAVLASLGVRRGGVVLLLMSRELEWLELMLGFIRIGAIASPGTVQSPAKDIPDRATADRKRDGERRRV